MRRCSRTSARRWRGASPWASPGRGQPDRTFPATCSWPSQPPTSEASRQRWPPSRQARGPTITSRSCRGATWTRFTRLSSSRWRRRLLTRSLPTRTWSDETATERPRCRTTGSPRPWRGHTQLLLRALGDASCLARAVGHRTRDRPVPIRPGPDPQEVIQQVRLEGPRAVEFTTQDYPELMRVLVAMLLLGLQVGQKAIYG